MSDPLKEEWYYNTATGNVELGPQSPMQHRMGPYATRKDAEQALKIAQQRNKHWDDQDHEWSNWGHGIDE
ncbi:hypothetical protein [Bifidobacterium gallicum]|nr:hypothetical protein [Bifidobacterium gallicum]KFI57275.1 hypothetical protein BGLCM_1519 [Bifidobacterium gallicum DSM 20093 = LMG 11596]